MQLITILMSSAVIAACVGYISKIREEKINNITGERSRWRKELKDIVAELSSYEKYGKKCQVTLEKLKCRLNAYGFRMDGNYPIDEKVEIKKDQHIWKVIYQIETKQGDFELQKKKLLAYIDCLLKSDWEKSKLEVTPTYLTFISLLFMILPSIVFLFYSLVNNEKSLDLNRLAFIFYMLLFCGMSSYLPIFLQRKKLLKKSDITWSLFVVLISTISFFIFNFLLYLPLIRYKWIFIFLLIDALFTCFINIILFTKDFNTEYEDSIISIQGNSEKSITIYFYKSISLVHQFRLDQFGNYLINTGHVEYYYNSKAYQDLVTVIINSCNDENDLCKVLGFRSKLACLIELNRKKKVSTISEFIQLKRRHLKPIIIYQNKPYLSKDVSAIIEDILSNK